MSQILLLSHEDLEQLYETSLVFDAVEKAFYSKGTGKVQMPPKMYLYFTQYDGDLRIMPAYMSDLDIAGVKIVNVHPKNREKGLLTVMALIELVDPSTGVPLTIMDGTMVTAWRTGAAGGVAAKYLANPHSTRMGIIGAGVQGRMQAIFTKYAIPAIEEIIVWDINKAVSQAYAKEMEEKLQVKITPVDEPRKAVENSDIITTCTPAREPILKADWIKKGAHINAIGADAPGKQELETRLLLKIDKIVVDDIEQASHSGEINVPLTRKEITLDNIYAEIGEIIAGKKPGRLSDSEITLFDSTGLAVQDVSTAYLLYQKALKTNKGSKIGFVKTTI